MWKCLRCLKLNEMDQNKCVCKKVTLDDEGNVDFEEVDIELDNWECEYCHSLNVFNIDDVATCKCQSKIVSLTFIECSQVNEVYKHLANLKKNKEYSGLAKKEIDQYRLECPECKLKMFDSTKDSCINCNYSDK